MSLPIFHSDSKDLSLLQTGWAQQLDPVVNNPANQSIIIPNVKLINGATVVNHLLGRQMQGWAIVDITSAATVYRSKPFNNLTLTLTSNAATTVSLMVF